MATRTPHTPARQRARSELNSKTPLTPSLVNAMSGVSLASHSPTKQIFPQHRRGGSKPSVADSSNPFIASSKGHTRSRSRPESPIKRVVSGGIPVNPELKRQASSGVIRRGGIESKLDVITNDYVPPLKSEMKRSRSTPGSHRDRGDRFITTREETEVAATLDMLSLNPQTSSPGHTARLIAATGVPMNKRVLAYHEAPPVAKDTTMKQQREIARPLYSRPGAAPTSTGATTGKLRKISTQPERVLDGPGIMDDFYLNLMAWSSQNVVIVGLDRSVYLWSADTATVRFLCDRDDTYISCVDFSNDGAFASVALGSGEVELWDVESGSKLRTMAGHQAQVASLSWSGHILSSGCGDGSVWHHDVRMPRHKVMELLGHTGEVCGLKWRPDGEMLASGGNDNVVNIWEPRAGDVKEGVRGNPKWTKRSHTAAVKALAWCPWSESLLATGGGSTDATINVWNSTTGARLHTLKTPAQVTSLQWAVSKKELMSTHGYPTNSIMVHAYPSFESMAEIRDAHGQRLLGSARGPAGDLVATYAGDENIKFWRIWEVEKKKKSTKERTGSGTGATNSGILSLR